MDSLQWQRLLCYRFLAAVLGIELSSCAAEEKELGDEEQEQLIMQCSSLETLHFSASVINCVLRPRRKALQRVL